MTKIAAARKERDDAVIRDLIAGKRVTDVINKYEISTPRLYALMRAEGLPVKKIHRKTNVERVDELLGKLRRHPDAKTKMVKLIAMFEQIRADYVAEENARTHAEDIGGQPEVVNG